MYESQNASVKSERIDGYYRILYEGFIWGSQYFFSMINYIKVTADT